MTVFSSLTRCPTTSADGFGVNTGRCCGARRRAEVSPSPWRMVTTTMALVRPDAGLTADARLEALERTQAEILDGQAELLAGQARILEALLKRRESGPPDARHARLLAALAEAMEDLDLSFDAGEVLAYARVDHALAEALKGCNVNTTADVGALFRSLRDQHLAGLRILRDGRTWRLERCTCCT